MLEHISSKIKGRPSNAWLAPPVPPGISAPWLHLLAESCRGEDTLVFLDCLFTSFSLQPQVDVEGGCVSSFCKTSLTPGAKTGIRLPDAASSVGKTIQTAVTEI